MKSVYAKLRYGAYLMVSIFRCNEQKENTKGQTFCIYEDKEQ